MVIARRKKKENRNKCDAIVLESKKKSYKVQTREKVPSSYDYGKANRIHHIPLPVVVVITFCSGYMFLFAFRDVFGTGKAVNDLDIPMQRFMNSDIFFDDSLDWRSKQGGLSTIDSITTDANKMGGLFLRKVGGAAAMAVHAHKLGPALFQPSSLHWAYGHFDIFFISSILANIAIFTLYQHHFNDMESAGASGMANLISVLLLTETFFLICALGYKKNRKDTVKVEVKKKTAKSSSQIVSRIAGRTVALVSTLVCIIAGRDMFLPGHVIPHIPRDDVYLEWTGAFLHSPREGYPEYEEYSLEAPLFVGEKFLSRLYALHLILFCFMKFTTVFFVKVGRDGIGMDQCIFFWKIQSLFGFLVLFIVRLFVSAAKSASLDLRWHLMCLAYESFILSLYAFL
uniref:Uncharacterized protein n=1 Tax=Corethron hystrix TaxID=216773 RepID=A0A7S1BLB5_9STRA|mmetsp:Transcript_30215/g.69261  ORF Transcript_30215/g.69261 Transcript_30215/m.69261 type:complete len:399 (+) Transcript_30215:133-1329(+)